MELWTIVPAIWITTCIMIVSRTYPLIKFMVDETEEGGLIMSWKYTHMILYAITVMFITPLCWQIAFKEEARTKWCIAYVKSILQEQNI